MNTINGPGISSNTFFSSGSVTPRAQPTAWFVCLHLGFRPKALKPITPHDLCLKKVVDPAHIFLWAAVSTKGNSFASRHRPADFSNYLMYRQLTKKIPFASQPRLRKNGARQRGWGLARKGAPPALRHHYHSSPLIRSDRHSSLLSKYRRFASTPSHSFCSTRLFLAGILRVKKGAAARSPVGTARAAPTLNGPC